MKKYLVIFLLFVSTLAFARGEVPEDSAQMDRSLLIPSGVVKNHTAASESDDGDWSVMTVDATNHLWVNTDGSVVSVAEVQPEDSAAVNLDDLFPNGIVRADTAASSGADGDWVWMISDANGKLYVNSQITSSNSDYVEDAAAGDASTGKAALVKRTDSIASSSGTDGDWSYLQVDASGFLYSTLDSSVTEDVAASAGGKLQGIGFVRANSAVSSGADGDWVWPISDASGKLWTNSQITASNDDYVEDTAAADASTGKALLLKRNDTLSSSSGTDGDWSYGQVDATGSLYVTTGSNAVILAATQVEDVAATTADDLFPNGVVRADTAASSGADGDWVWMVSDANGKLYVNSQITSSHFDQVEDVALADAQTGIAVIAKRADAAASSSGSDGDSSYLITDANGGLWVTPTGTITISGTITTNVEKAEDVAHGSGDLLFPTVIQKGSPADISGEGDYTLFQMSGGRLWSSSTITASNTDIVEDAALGDAATGTAIITQRLDTAASSAGANGDAAYLITDANGRVYSNSQVTASNDDYVEDAAAADAATGKVGLTKRADTAATSADTDGDWAYFITDANGKLHVNTGLTDQVQYAEDTVLADGSTGNVVLVQRANSAVASGADGDAVYLISDTNGKLWVNNGLTDQVQYAEDTVLADASTGNVFISKRVDAAVSSAGADGDAAFVNTDATGKLWVTGTHLEDVAHSSGDAGIQFLAVMETTNLTALAAAGDYTPPQLDMDGAMYVTDRMQPDADNTIPFEIDGASDSQVVTVDKIYEFCSDGDAFYNIGAASTVSKARIYGGTCKQMRMSAAAFHYISAGAVFNGTLVKWE